MKKKALIITNLTRRLKAGHFTMINPLIELGYEVHWAANFKEYDDELDKAPIKLINIDFERNPYNLKNIKAFLQLNNILKEGNYDLVHCNSPIGGALGRLCSSRNNVKNIIYTAHGFHFFKGAPLINNIIYKNIERYLAKKTDLLITINNEDYESSKNFKLRNGKGKKIIINGMGIDTQFYKNVNVNRNKKRKSLGINIDDIVCISTGDLIKRKNYEVAIKAIAKCECSNIKFLICGDGILKESLMKLCLDLGVQDKVIFLGFRNDIDELLKISDIFLFSTKQEGLARSLMEAMASGISVIASDIRGNNDLIIDGKNGFLVEYNDYNGFAHKIDLLANDVELRNKFINFNLNLINKYDFKSVEKDMKVIYKEIGLNL
ncbi:glycosyltransferase family 4 protein [Clostridium perfringens]|nr:glycosyltransferase family 4 protein [Clostridium perfringens]